MVNLEVGNGTLALVDGTGIIVTGDGTAATPLMLTGELSAINTALAAGLTYTPDLNFAGTDTLMITSDMLREGVELIPADDVQGGVRVRVVDDDLEIDLTSDAIARLISRYMLPRFRALMAGAE